jgi:hypothetical protein
MGIKVLNGILKGAARLKIPKFIKSKWFIGAFAFVLGILLVLTIRFATYNPERVHYHANFAMYINGQKEEFKNPIYYIQIADMCSADATDNPTDRAHMHSGVNNVVHVEDHAVTWGQFFQNIGWVVDPRVIRSFDGLYTPGGQNKITFMLNGKQVDGAMRQVIKDQDKLLIDFGSTSPGAIQKEYRTIPSTAHKYDTAPDPKSCSGSKPVTIRDRLKHMF